MILFAYGILVIQLSACHNVYKIGLINAIHVTASSYTNVHTICEVVCVHLT